MTNKESQTVEYKQTWRNDCLKAVSAFANSDGGVLIVGLDDRQIKAVLYVKKNGTINNSKYQQINDVGKTTATEELSKLVEIGLLTEPTARGRGAKYELKC